MQKQFSHGGKRRYTSAQKSRNNYRNTGRNNRNKGSRIDPQKFINKAIAPEVEVPYEPTHTFHDFGLNQRTVDTLDYLKFTKPSEIQDRTIPLSIEGKDIIGLANTGTGKTAAFLLPTITKLAADRKLMSVLILAPTRELALQIDDEFRRFSSGQKLYSALLIGGANIAKQIRQIERGPHIVIGTPGRVKDLINRQILRLSTINTFVLDEADRMCDMGFERDIRMIAGELPQNRQTLCFSATMTPSVQSIVTNFMHDPEAISTVKTATNDHIEQSVIYYETPEQKLDKLVDLLRSDDLKKTIIFGETKFGVQRLANRLSDHDIPAAAIHGNKSQSQRERALRQFKDTRDDTNVLVATDVAARGLDISDITHVINFDPPKVYDDYVHRIGRTGRAGKSGVAYTLVQSKITQR